MIQLQRTFGVPSQYTTTLSAQTLCEPSHHKIACVNKRTQLFLMLVAFAVCMQYSNAQTGNKLAAGINANAAVNMHRGALTTNEGVLECGSFENATTLGWTLGNYANIPLTPSIAFAPSLYYHKANGTFTASNPVTPLIALQDGSTTPLSTEHALSVSLDYVTLDAMLRYYLDTKWYAALGPSVGFTTRNAFEQEEHILSPTGATFVDGSTTRRIAAGNFTDNNGHLAGNNIRISAVAGIGAMFPLGESFILNPEISYQYSFSNVISINDWKVHSLRVGAGLMYVLSAPPPPPLPPPVEDKKEAPVAQVMPPPMALLDVHNIETDGTELNYAEVTVNQHRTQDILPLLPYVFFESGSADLSERYTPLQSGNTSSFTETTLPNDQIAVYHHLLNIIGLRMKRYTNTTLSVTGCVEPKDESGKNSLAMNRATNVKKYLHDVWGISEDRITTRSRELPEIVSTRRIDDGRTENRRAEITASDPRILAPVYVRNAKNTVTPNEVLLQPEVVYQGTVKEAEYTIKDNSGSVLFTTKQSSDDKVRAKLSDAVIHDPTKPLLATVKITTDDGRVTEAQRPIPVRRTFTSSRANAQVVRDTLIERYSMLLFNFDRASTIASNNDQILSLIRSRIRTSSSVDIEGMTDYIGRKKNNQRLSESRANAVEKSITDFIKPVAVDTKGLGEVDLFDNTIPEGRFYNRRVFVEIATPLNTELDEEGELR